MDDADRIQLLKRIAEALHMSPEQLSRFPEDAPPEHEALADLFRMLAAFHTLQDVRERRRLVELVEAALREVPRDEPLQ